MKKILLVLLAGLLICSVSNVSLAQEEEDVGFSWGSVVGVSSNEIIISEYDYETEEELQVAYVINSDTESNNVNSLEGIYVGDVVNIDYVVSGGKKVAKIITFEQGQEDYEKE